MSELYLLGMQNNPVGGNILVEKTDEAPVNRRHIQLIFRQAAVVGLSAKSDADLLRRFAAERDEAAFAELVRRHGRLVWALCRNLLPSEADADDAFQATFLALTRSPGSVRDGGRVGPWLHGVAYRVCLKAKRTAARRKRREVAAATAEADRPVADSAWDAALAAVHEEVCRLPESLRVPFVLCCLEGKGVTEAAAQLGWKLGTLSARLTRAKQTLIDRLAGRGLPAAVVGAATVAGGSATAEIPASLVTRTADLAFTAGPVSPTILSLTHGVTGMTLYRTKLLAAAVLLAGGLATSVGSGWLAPAGAQAPPPKVESKPIPREGGVFDFYVGFDQRQPASKFVYFVPKAPLDVIRFEVAVWDFGKRFGDGYQFAGVVRMSTDNLTSPQVKDRVFIEDAAALKDLRVADILVFKRTAQARNIPAIIDSLPVPSEPVPSEPVLVPDGGTITLDGTLNGNNLTLGVKATADSRETKELEAQIKKLQAQLEQLRAQGRKDITLPAPQVGIEPAEMVTILDTLAKKRFGPGYKRRLELYSSHGLRLVGDAEAVEWAVDIVKKLNAK